MKTCYKCNQIKSLSDFYYRKDTGSHRNECKECTKAAKAVRESVDGIKEIRALKEKQRRIDKKEQIKAVRDKRYADPNQRLIIKENGKRSYEKLKISKPEILKAANSYQRAKRKIEINKETSSTTSEIRTWIKEAVKICSYCNNYCLTNYQIDHIYPISKGGTHTIDNFTIACPSCNASKNATSLLIWMAKLTNRSRG